MTLSPIQICLIFTVSYVLGSFVALFIFGGSSTSKSPIREYIKIKYDFRDDAPEIMQMLKRKYKSKDGLRKAKNVVDHIYQMYENRCKKCTK